MNKILVIEDHEAVRASIVEVLRAEGFDALAAENGSIGVQMALFHIPNLIICDVMMPELDGYGALKALSQNPVTAAIPFIFLTAKADRGDLRQGMELGADDYLTKPFSIIELLQAINTRLKKQAEVIHLQQKLQNLQQLNVLKDEFFNTASHDLRAPITNMKVALKLLKMATTDEQRNRYINLLQTECERENELLNDLLDWQRLEADAYTVSLDVMSLQEWLPSFIEPFYTRTHDRQQTLNVEFCFDTPPLISDQANLKRILTELLNNACKYTPAGGEIVFKLHKYQPLEIAAVSASITFTVSNQAEIPATALPHIFDKFYRVTNADVAKQVGTGLGLTIVQKLVARMQGTIQVESVGGWTTFTVQFPVQPK